MREIELTIAPLPDIDMVNWQVGGWLKLDLGKEGVRIKVEIRDINPQSGEGGSDVSL